MASWEINYSGRVHGTHHLEMGGIFPKGDVFVYRRVGSKMIPPFFFAISWFMTRFSMIVVLVHIYSWGLHTNL